MPNHHKLIGLVAIVIIASVGGVSYAALDSKPETTQVQQTPAQTTATSAPPDTTATPAPAATPTPTPTPAASSPTPTPAQTTPKTTGSAGTSGGGSTTPTPAPAPTPTPTPPPPAPTYTYRSGTYSTAANYSTPGGGESLGVTLTITNDVVTGSSLDTSQAHGDAAYYQGQFAANYQPSVVSKALAGLNLSRVAGASLTTTAFNSALNTIRNQAKN